MRIVINEQQYRDIFLIPTIKKKIKVHENQFRRIFLLEQGNDDKTDQAIKNYIGKFPPSGVNALLNKLTLDNANIFSQLTEEEKNLLLNNKTVIDAGKKIFYNQLKKFVAGDFKKDVDSKLSTLDKKYMAIYNAKLDQSAQQRKESLLALPSLTSLDDRYNQISQGNSVVSGPPPCMMGERIHKSNASEYYNQFGMDSEGRGGKLVKISVNGCHSPGRVGGLDWCGYLTFDENGWSTQCINNPFPHSVTWEDVTWEDVREALHYILPAIAAIAIWFPGPGTVIAYVAEGLDILLYIYEGDVLGAVFGTLFIAIPGLGVYLRKIGTPGVKAIANLFKEYYYLHKGTKTLGGKNMMKHILPQGKEATEYLVREAKKKLSKLEYEAFEYMIKHADDLSKIGKMSRKEIEALIKQSDDIWESYVKYYKTFGRGSKFLTSLMNLTKFEKVFWGLGVMGFIYLTKSGKGKIIGEKGAEFILWLKEQFGWDNITVKDIPVINQLINKFSAEEIANLAEEGGNIKELDIDEEKFKEFYYQMQNLDTLSSDSGVIYRIINDDNIDLDTLISIDKDTKKSPLNNKNVRSLPLSTDYKWEKANNCRGSVDGMGKSLTTLNSTSGEDWKGEEHQISIEKYGKKIEDAAKLGKNYIYSYYEGYWFWKDKNKIFNEGTPVWNYISDCSVCYKLQAYYNHQSPSRIKSINDVDMDLQYWNEELLRLKDSLKLEN